MESIAVIGLKGLPAFGGAATVGENLVARLKEDYNFTIYSVSSHTHLETGSYNGFYQIVFSAIKNKKLNTLLYYVKSALHAIFIGKYDLIHLHHSDAAFILLLLRIKYKVVVTTHGVHNLGLLPKWKKYKQLFKFQIKFMLPLANKITCVSKTEQNWLLEYYGIKANFIPNGITTNFQKFTNNYAYSIFFGAGRIIQSKGCDSLLKALNNINFSLKIAIAGELNQTPDYKEIILQLSKNLDVTFLGLVKDKNELLNYIHSSKLFIYPSERESMSMMLLEAASVKTPILCSNIIENKDIFSEDEVLFFSLEKKYDLDKKITWALDNYDIMKNKAEKAYGHIMKTNNWDNIKNEYKMIYDSLL
ncbi:MAG: glycosyltransferase [Planctomycetia bacterium]|nr:glycosyltransferase [Planctomycetia bacterium]